MQTALITGGNRGIGLAVARRLAALDLTVIIAARREQDARAAAEEVGARGVVLDVTVPATIHAAARWIDDEFGSLDVLVNNAGILPEVTNSEPKEIVDLAMFERTFATNLFGPVAVLEAMLPLLRRSAGGRVVNVSSTMGSLADQTNPSSPYYSMVMPAYQSSKAALNNITIALAKQLTDTTIKVTSVCPGFVRTDLTPISREQAPTSPEEAAEVVVQAATLPATAETGTFVGAGGAIAW
ncbi:short-chain dehydrogenase [Actinophytocola xinjiangensis]|uniref:Short-chain dehydrogenase n=2 Tax=Actinophytocola xinjiangensis TaxID=485602 RepID=A0A7Z1AZ72_9PSEU|nr:short-chain dehydrogenase [Actinophytocola xinjiangensis]